MSKVFLTQEGFEKLQEELDHLIQEKRVENADRLREAIEGGDLIDNAEYEAAKREQAFTEGRIKELQILLASARVIDESKKNPDIVDMGSIVTIQEEGYEAEVYKVVGAAEADPRVGKISNESPIGKAIMDKRVGDLVQINAPEGSYEVKVVKVE